MDGDGACLAKVMAQLERIEGLKKVETQALDAISGFLESIAELGDAGALAQPRVVTQVVPQVMSPVGSQVIMSPVGSEVGSQVVPQVMSQVGSQVMSQVVYDDTQAVSRAIPLKQSVKRKTSELSATTTPLPQPSAKKRASSSPAPTFTPTATPTTTQAPAPAPAPSLDPQKAHDLILRVGRRGEPLDSHLPAICASCTTVSGLVAELKKVFLAPLAHEAAQNTLTVVCDVIKRTGHDAEVLKGLLDALYDYILLEKCSEEEAGEAAVVAKWFAMCCGRLDCVWMAELLCYEAMRQLGMSAVLNATQMGMACAVISGVVYSEQPVMQADRMWVLAGLGFISELMKKVSANGTPWAFAYLENITVMLGCHQMMTSAWRIALQRLQGNGLPATFDDALCLGLHAAWRGTTFVQTCVNDLTPHASSLLPASALAFLTATTPVPSLASTPRHLLTLTHLPDDVATCALIALIKTAPSDNLIREVDSSLELTDPDWLVEYLASLRDSGTGQPSDEEVTG